MSKRKWTLILSSQVLFMILMTGRVLAQQNPTPEPKTGWQNITATLCKSTGVDTPKKTQTPAYKLNVGSLIVFPGGDIGVILGQDGGFYRSTNQGATWTKSGEPWMQGANGKGNLTMYYPKHVKFLLNNGSVAVSSDNGATWGPQIKGSKVPLPGANFSYFDYGDMDLLDNFPPKTIIGRVHHPDFQGGCGMVSTDGGATWNWAAAPLKDMFRPQLGVVNTTTLIRGQAVKDSGFSSPAPGVFRSTNLGQTWTKVADYTLQESTCPTHYGPNLYWVAKEGVIVSRDGGNTWSICGNSPANPSCGPYFGDNEQQIMVLVVTGTKSGYYITGDGGKNWALAAPYTKFPGQGNLDGLGWDAAKNIIYANSLGGNVWKLQLGPSSAKRSGKVIMEPNKPEKGNKKSNKTLTSDIRGWRNDGTGIFPDTDPPIEWGPGKHEVWSTDMGGGMHSSPVLIGDKIITAVEPFSLICLSTSDGKVLWKTSNDLWKDVLSKEEATKARKLAEGAKPWLKAINEVEKLIEDAGAGMPGTNPNGEYVDMPLEKRMAVVKAAYVKRWELVQAKNRPAGAQWVSLGAAHSDGGSAAATPVTDGKYVYMVFGNGLGICCELATGKRVWYSKLPGEPGIQHHGTSGSSPVLAGDIVVMRFGHWIYGLKKSNGAQVWEGREPEQWYRIRCTEHYTPLVVTIDKTPVVVTSSGQFIRAADGKMLADLDLYATTGGEIVAMPLYDQGVIYFTVGPRQSPDYRLDAKVMGGKNAKYIRNPQVMAVKLPERVSRDTLPTSILWKTETSTAITGTSPVVFKGLLYTRDMNNEMLRVFDCRDGKMVYEQKLDWLGKSLTYAPFVVAGGNLYINSSRTDRTIIVKPGREYMEVARNVREIKKQDIHGWAGGFGLLYGESPVFSGTSMYWREGNMMYCFDKNAPSKPAVSDSTGKNQPEAGKPLVGQVAGTKKVASEWPHSGGPTRDGISLETGLFANLRNGPVVVWKDSLGTGFTSIAIVGGLAYAAGNRDDKDIITAFDAITGKPSWTYSYDEPLNDNGFEGGPCATPTVSDGKLYSFSRSGIVICLDAATGKLVWNKNLAAELRTESPDYGYAGSPTVIGARLYLNIGSYGCCLDAATGKVIWKSPNGKAGYAAPIPITSAGRSFVLIFSSDGLYAVDDSTGQVGMKYPWEDSMGATAPAPLVRGNRIFISSGFSRGGVMLEVTAGMFREVWRTEEMSNNYSNCVEVGGFLYGFDQGTLRCLEWANGKSRWEQDEIGLGTLLAAEGRLVILSETGELVIAEAKPDAFHEVTRSKVLKRTCWSMPAIAGGRIYCRNSSGNLVCIELK